MAHIPRTLPLLLSLALMACSDSSPAPSAESGQPGSARTKATQPARVPGAAESSERQRTGPPVAEVHLQGSGAAARAHSDALDPSLAADLEKGGDVMVRRGDLAGAVSRYARSVRVTRRLHEAKPEDTPVLAALSSRIEKAAYTCRIAGRVDEAIVLYRQHVQVAQRLAGRGPDHAAAGSGALQSLHILGDLLLQAGKPREALANFEAALERLERAEANVKSTTAHRRNASVALGRIGFALQKLEKFDEGRAALTRSVEIAAEIASGPDAQQDPSLHLEHAGALTGLAALEGAARALDAAQQHLTAALEIHRTLAGQAALRGSPQILHGLSVAAARLARVELERQQLDAARELATESLRALDAVLPQASNANAALREKVSRLELLADIARAGKDWKLATARRIEALGILENITKQSGGAAVLWMECARAHQALAALHRDALAEQPSAATARKDHSNQRAFHRSRALMAARQAVERDGALQDWAGQFERELGPESPDEHGRATTDD